MNERIRELAEQCGLPTSQDLTLTYEVEKFAELIVRECALTCETVGRQEDSPYGAIAWDCAAALREQFGVKS